MRAAPPSTRRVTARARARLRGARAVARRGATSIAVSSASVAAPSLQPSRPPRAAAGATARRRCTGERFRRQRRRRTRARARTAGFDGAATEESARGLLVVGRDARVGDAAGRAPRSPLIDGDAALVFARRLEQQQQHVRLRSRWRRRLRPQDRPRTIPSSPIVDAGIGLDRDAGLVAAHLAERATPLRFEGGYAYTIDVALHEWRECALYPDVAEGRERAEADAAGGDW